MSFLRHYTLDEYQCDPLPPRTYLENLEDEMIKVNEQSRQIGDDKSWSNKKAKTRKCMTPRGPFFRKFQRSEHSRKGNQMISNIRMGLL